MTHNRGTHNTLTTSSQKVMHDSKLLNRILEFSGITSFGTALQVNRYMRYNADLNILAAIKVLVSLKSDLEKSIEKTKETLEATKLLTGVKVELEKLPGLQHFLKYGIGFPWEFIKKLQEQNKPDERGKTPLIHLVQKDSPLKSMCDNIPNGRYHLMTIMIDLCGYDINHVDKSDNTVLDYVLDLYDPKDQQSILMLDYLLNHPRLKNETLFYFFTNNFPRKIPCDPEPNKLSWLGILERLKRLDWAPQERHYIFLSIVQQDIELVKKFFGFLAEEAKKIQSSTRLAMVMRLVQKQTSMWTPPAADKNSIAVLGFLIDAKLINVNEIYTDALGNQCSLLHLLAAQLNWIRYFLQNYQFSHEVLNLKATYTISSPPRLVLGSQCENFEEDFLGRKPSLPFIPSPTNLVELFLMSHCLKEFLEKRDINLEGVVYYAYAVLEHPNAILNAFDLIKEKLAKSQFDIPAEEKAFLEQVLAEEKTAESKDAEKQSEAVSATTLDTEKKPQEALATTLDTEKKSEPRPATTFLQKPLLERFDFYYLQLAKKAYRSGDKKEILALAEKAVNYGYSETFNFLSRLKDHEGQYFLDINYNKCKGWNWYDVTFPMLAVQNQRWNILLSILTHPALSVKTLNARHSQFEPTILEEMINRYAQLIPVKKSSSKTRVKINEEVREPIECYLKVGGRPERWDGRLINLDEIFHTQHGDMCYGNFVINDHRQHPGVKELYQIMAPYTRLCNCHVRACHCVTQAVKNLASSVYGLFVTKPTPQADAKMTVKLESKRL